MDSIEINQENTSLDPNKQIKARQYARISRRLMLVELSWNGLYAFFWLFTGWSSELRNWLLDLRQNNWLVVAGFILIYAAGDSLVSLPLSYYSGFVLPHKFEQSNQILKEWIKDHLKGMAISLPLGLFMIEIIYLILRIFPENWWLIAAGIMFVFNILLANLYPTLIAPLFNKYIPLGEEHADLEKRLLKLAHEANTHIKGVYKFDMSRQSKAANAGLTGIGNSRRIVLADTMISEFSADEIETVLAHELAHHIHRDFLSGIFISTGFTILGFYIANLGLNWGIQIFSFKNAADIAALPFLTILMGVFGILTMLPGNAFSRWRERKADQYALEKTQNPEAFISAMTRLANQNLAEIEPERWVELLLHSHPALGRRIKMAEEFIEAHSAGKWKKT
ncbi:MAG: M48 family metallopeptidase [Anaerolineaceae bacterium]|nr:M48 family metallopeptidase [Anaerolineaceae bacterium]